MRSKRPEFSAAYLRHILRYNRRTGIFRWKKPSKYKPELRGKIAGSVGALGYRTIYVNGRPYKAHLLAWFYVHGRWPTTEIDHRDTFEDHNWIGNLRKATRAQNCANASLYRNNRSGLKGVDRRGNRWRAQIQCNKKKVNLGVFDTRHEAHRAYAAMAQQLFGLFARAA